MNTEVFTRARSGYVRDFNTLDVFVFNVIGFALGLALSTNPPFIAGFAPNAEIATVLILGAILAVLNGLTYGWFGGIMPSTGGDYVFVTRSLGHAYGFVASWAFTACQLFGLAINLGWIVKVGLAPALATLGVSTKQASLINYSEILADPTTVAIASLAMLSLYYAAMVFDFGINRYAIYVLFAIGLSGPLLMTVAFASHNQEEFAAKFDSFMLEYNSTPDAYALAIATWHDSGGKLDPTRAVIESLRAIPLGFLCFMGFTYSVYVGGEVREPAKAQLVGILAALLLGAITFVACMSLYVGTVGAEFHAAIGHPQVMEKLRMPGNSINLFAGILEPGIAFNAVMQFGNLMWFLLVPYVMLQVCTHNVVAWACDRMLPSFVLSRFGPANAPWVAGAIVSLGATVFIGVIYSSGFSLVGAVALAAGTFLLTGLGAFFYSHGQVAETASVPYVFRERVFGKSIFQLVGLTSALGFLWILYTSLWYPDIRGGTINQALGVFLAVYISGVCWYGFATAQLRKQAAAVGVDLESLFRQIPSD